MSSPAPKSPEQSDKSKKYDRQIRLWGEHGQCLLEAAKICLINASALGCETLKGIVLPGIGGFTIVDGSVVTEDDLGANFFVNSNLVGKSRAKACTQLLQELNPDVNGDYVDESVDYILTNRPAFFETFDVIIASDLNEQTLLELSNALWKANIPLIYCRSLGFFGSIRLQIKEHCITETHPEGNHFDLRLEYPFPALKKHLQETPVTNKVPWLTVINKYFELWKSETNKTCPKTFSEKLQLRNMIRKDMKNDDENYEEAIAAANWIFGFGNVPNNLKKIFEDEACININKHSKPFWIMAKALREFVNNENNGLLPLPGVLPDMTAESNSYISLQNIYRQQALQDSDAVYRKCQIYLRELGLPEDTITEWAARLFCREAANLHIYHGSKISDEYEKNTFIVSLVNDLERLDIETEIYFALRAYERFLTEYGTIPGECFAEADISRLKIIANKILMDLGSHCTISDDVVHEICRYGGAEIHSISAFLGGFAAHEVIKIITKQYIPINNTLLYNGITSECVVKKL